MWSLFEEPEEDHVKRRLLKTTEAKLKRVRFLVRFIYARGNARDRSM